MPRPNVSSRFLPLVFAASLLLPAVTVSAAGPLTGAVAVTVHEFPFGSSPTSCALVAGGIVKCWGVVPTDIAGLSGGITAISGACALTATGTVKCMNEFFAVSDVPGLTGVTAISSGVGHNCALTVAGGVKCWGDNSFGQLGNGTTTNSATPVDVLGLSSGVVAIGASKGEGHTCAVMSGGGVKCWGGNFLGQLGDGTTTNRLSPVDVVGLSGVTAISLGGASTCALTGGGGVKCWGSILPSLTLTPVDVAGLSSGVSAISIGGAHTCALLTGGGVKCWGSNNIFGPGLGLVGDGTIYDQPTPVDVVGLSSGVVQIEAGDHNDCALLASGRVMCWGDGVGHADFAPVPVLVGDLATQSITFGPLGNHDVNEPPLAVSGSATSGLPLVFRSMTPKVCTASGSAVTPVKMGICIIAAAQPGDDTFGAPNEVHQTFLVTGTPPGAPPRLTNISTRMQMLTGNDALIAGFAVAGPGSKTVVIRARGPSLASSGVTNYLPDPALQLFSGSTPIASNDSWQNPLGLTIQSIGFAPPDIHESALLVTLAPGLYTAIVTSGGSGSPSGTALVEIFEIDTPESPLINIATRGKVLTGNDVMIGGFIIQGESPQTVVVRARGPSLAALGVTGTLADPMLQLVRSSDNATVATNDNWIAAANATDIQASGFAPSDAHEAAILITLQPGAYTAIVSGVGGTTGVGLVEVFAVQ
jgi:hypothetical protein